MFCCLHCSLLAAGPNPNNCSVVRANSSTFEDLKSYGKALRDCGHLPEAMDVFRQAIQQAKKSNNRKNEADALMLLWSAQVLSFQYRDALDSFQTGRDIAQAIPDSSLCSRASGNIATIYIELGDFVSAEAESDRAISLLERIPNQSEEVRRRLRNTLLNHAVACFELKKAPQGFKDYKEALGLTTSDDDGALVLNERGVALMQEHRVAAANSDFQNALQLSIRSGKPTRLVALEREHLAELELQKSHPDFYAALSLMDKAFAEHSSNFMGSPQYYPIHIRAEILLGLGRKSDALPEFLHAVDAAHQWRLGALPGDMTEMQTVAKLQQVYADYAHLAADLALEQNDKTLMVNAFEVLAEKQSRWWSVLGRHPMTQVSSSLPPMLNLIIFRREIPLSVLHWRCARPS